MSFPFVKALIHDGVIETKHRHGEDCNECFLIVCQNFDKYNVCIKDVDMSEFLGATA